MAVADESSSFNQIGFLSILIISKFTIYFAVTSTPWIYNAFDKVKIPQNPSL